MPTASETFVENAVVISHQDGDRCRRLCERRRHIDCPVYLHRTTRLASLKGDSIRARAVKDTSSGNWDTFPTPQELS